MSLRIALRGCRLVAELRHAPSEAVVRSQPRSAAAAGTAPPARATASPRATPRSLAPRRAAVRLPLLGPAAMSHSLCSRSVTASQNDSPSSRNVAGRRFQALLDLVVLAAGSCTHLDQTRGGVELLGPPACDAFGGRVRRCQTRALGLSLAPERAAGYAQARRALWVPVDAPYEVFALCGPRAARPVDCRSAHSKNALNPARVAVSSRARPDSPPSSRSQFARSPRFSPSPSVRRGSRSRAGHSLSHMHSHVLGLAPLAVVRKTRLPTARRS